MSVSTRDSNAPDGRRRTLTSYLEDARRVLSKRAGVATKSPATILADTDVGMLSEEKVRELVEPHLFYVVQVASEYGSRDASFEDLLAEGNIGLVEAAYHFDPGHDVKFLTYATWWVRKRILEFLVREGQPVRLTRYAREKRRDLRSVRDLLHQRLGREATHEEIAEESGLDLATVRERIRGKLVVLSLEQSASPQSEVSLGETLPAKDERTPEELVVLRSLRKLVRSEVARLTPRERKIIENRFSFEDQDPMTFQEIGDQLGLSRERARQIEREALARLRRRLQWRISARMPCEPYPASTTA